MKKLIQLCSILSLAVVFTVISAQAQVSKQYSAEVPFDFTVNQKSYKAGSYVIKVANLSSSVVAVSLGSKEENILYTLSNRKADQSLQDEAKLVFTREGEKQHLSALSLQNMDIPINKAHEAKSGFRARRAVKNSKSKGKPESKVQTAVVAVK